jgi:Uma2 family endonuclease
MSVAQQAPLRPEPVEADPQPQTLATRHPDPAMMKLLALKEEMRASEAAFRQRFRELLEPHIKAEFIDGEIIVDSPARLDHIEGTGSLLSLVRTFIQATATGGTVLFEKALVELRRNDVEPDLCYWKKDRADTFQPEQYQFPPPDWVAEFLSPSSERRDRGKKFDAYQDAGVGEYWLVDAHLRRLEAFVLKDGKYVDAGKFSDQDAIVGPATLPDLRFPLKALFDDDANLAALRGILAG